MTRIGILGAGGISDTHARAALAIDGVEVVAVHGTNRDKAAALARATGAAVHDNLDAFLAHPMDIVAIGSPSGVHADQAIAAVRRGLHVLVEKPLDITTARIDDVIGEADRAGVKVGVFFQDRLTPDLVEMKTAHRRGAARRARAGVGPREVVPSARVLPRLQVARHEESGRRRRPHEPGHSHARHDALDVRSRRARDRAASRRGSIEIDVEDTAAALFEFENGGFGVFEASTAAFPGFPRRIEVTGTKGSLVHEQEARPAQVADASGHQRVIEDFLAAIRTNGTPACDAREGRRSVALIEAIYESARTGGSVTP